MTKEERRAYDKAYYLANKEKRINRSKKYASDNKDKVKDYNKSYRLANRDELIKSQSKRRESSRHNPTVYLLPKENYVGVTERLTHRIHNHRIDSKRDVSGFVILEVFDNRQEAIEFERLCHSEGYKGKHKNNLYI